MNVRWLCSHAAIEETLLHLAEQCDSWSFVVPQIQNGTENRLWSDLQPHFPRLELAIVSLKSWNTCPQALFHLRPFGTLRILSDIDQSSGCSLFNFRHGGMRHVVFGGYDFMAPENSDCLHPTTLLENCPDTDGLMIDCFMEQFQARAHIPTFAELRAYHGQHQQFLELRDRAKQIWISPPFTEDAIPDTAPDLETENHHFLLQRRSILPPLTQSTPGNGARRKSTVSSPTAFDTNSLMVTFRKISRKQGPMECLPLLRAVARKLGHTSLRKSVKIKLQRYLRIAIRRKILIQESESYLIATRSLTDYERSEHVAALLASMRRGKCYDRTEIARDAVGYFGFSNLGKAAKATMRSAINSAIRRNQVEAVGTTEIRRIR